MGIFNFVCFLIDGFNKCSGMINVKKGEREGDDGYVSEI
jgi:hypothetical protein